MADETAVTTATTGAAQVFDLHALKAFAPDTMSIAGEEVTVPAGAIVKFPATVPHDVRNLQGDRCVIMFVKINPKLVKAGAAG